MASRGIWRFMSVRTRRSLTLTWTALFVFSLLLQYMSFAAAPPVLAVHNEGVFELEGNATSSACSRRRRLGQDLQRHLGRRGQRVPDGYREPALHRRLEGHPRRHQLGLG